MISGKDITWFCGNLAFLLRITATPMQMAAIKDSPANASVKWTFLESRWKFFRVKNVCLQKTQYLKNRLMFCGQNILNIDLSNYRFSVTNIVHLGVRNFWFGIMIMVLYGGCEGNILVLLDS